MEVLEKGTLITKQRAVAGKFTWNQMNIS